MHSQGAGFKFFILDHSLKLLDDRVICQLWFLKFLFRLQFLRIQVKTLPELNFFWHFWIGYEFFQVILLHEIIKSSLYMHYIREWICWASSRKHWLEWVQWNSAFIWLWGRSSPGFGGGITKWHRSNCSYFRCHTSISRNGWWCSRTLWFVIY